MSRAGTAGAGRYGAVELTLLLAASVVWGAAYVFIRQGIVLGASPLAFAAVRYLLSAVGFVALAAARREAFPSRQAILVSAGIGGILIIGLYGGFLYWGEQYTTGGYAAVLASTAPLLTVAFGFSLLSGERLGWLGLSGMAVGFVGAVVLVLPQLVGSSALGSWQGPLFVLAAMVSTALGTVLLRRLGRGRPQGLWQIGSQFTVAGLLLSFAALVVPSSASLPLTSGVLGALAFLVVLSSLVGYFAYFALHHRVGPVRANVVAYLAPIVGVVVGTGFFGEPVTFWEFTGVVVVLVGVTLVLWESARRVAASP
ncbi:MAG TPA: EamA family transporter [Thermoplasmata archaeon]|nr:EamA family transporter [Thermoplasmata archaeon]